MIIADGASSPSLLQLDVANAPYSLLQFIEFSVIQGFIRIFERKNTQKVFKKQIIRFFFAQLLRHGLVFLGNGGTCLAAFICYIQEEGEGILPSADKSIQTYVFGVI